MEFYLFSICLLALETEINKNLANQLMQMVSKIKYGFYTLRFFMENGELYKAIHTVVRQKYAINIAVGRFHQLFG